MRALVCKKLGDPTLPLGSKDAPLLLDEAHPEPGPLPGGKAVRIRVAAGSLNFADALTVLGKYQEKPPLPFILGSEISGIVTEVGPAVTGVTVGDHVVAVVGTGGYADEVIADEASVFKVPNGVNLHAAAGLPVAFGTAHVGLVHRAGLRAGQVLLVLGAAGGVGMAAVQIGKMCGAIVIAAARGEAKAALLRRLGADCVIDTAPGGKALTDGAKAFLAARKRRGVDVLLDPVGGAQFKEGLRLLAWGGHIVVVGFASGEIPSIQANVALVKNLTVHGIYWGSYMKNRPAVLRHSMETLLGWLQDGSVTVHVSGSYDLCEANKAIGVLLGRGALGKVILNVNDEAALHQYSSKHTSKL